MFKKPPYQKINHVYFAGKTLRLWFTLFTPPRYGRQSNAQRRGRGMLKPRIDRRITQLVGLQTRIGRHEVLLPTNQNYDKIRDGNLVRRDIDYAFS